MNDAETIVLVDLDDRITGSETKVKVHKEGLLHRAFSVFIVDGEKMLIQKRNVNKYHSGGLWSNSCCSHQRLNENLDEAVHRRVFEELGIKCDLREIFKFVYRTEFDNGLSEYELDHVFLGSYSGDVVPDMKEVEEVKWIDIDALADQVENESERFSYWFRISLPRVLEFLKK